MAKGINVALILLLAVAGGGLSGILYVQSHSRELNLSCTSHLDQDDLAADYRMSTSAQFVLRDDQQAMVTLTVPSETMAVITRFSVLWSIVMRTFPEIIFMSVK